MLLPLSYLYPAIFDRNSCWINLKNLKINTLESINFINKPYPNLLKAAINIVYLQKQRGFSGVYSLYGMCTYFTKLNG